IPPAKDPSAPMNSPFSWSTDYRHPTPWDQDFPPLSLPDILAASVARKGDAPMLAFMGRHFSYRAVAAGLARDDRGLHPRATGTGTRHGPYLPTRRHHDP